VLTAADDALDQPGRLQDADVAGDAGERHRQRRGEIGDPCVSRTQRDEQGPAGGVRERRVGPVQDLIFNHLVDLTSPA
jgi:hypothetical protein